MFKVQDTRAIQRMRDRAFQRDCAQTGGGPGNQPPPPEDPDDEGEAIANPQYEPNPLPTNKFTPSDDSGLGSSLERTSSSTMDTGRSIMVDTTAVESTATFEVSNPAGGTGEVIVEDSNLHSYARQSTSRGIFRISNYYINKLSMVMIGA